MPRARIPVLDLKPEIDLYRHELMSAMQNVIDDTRFILGPNVAAFEEEFAAFIGVRWAVGVNSGTDALVIALRALGVGPGDEVITTAFSFFATAEAVSAVGATPVFVDIDPATFNIQPEVIEARITPRTRAIIPVHLFGLSANMDAINSIAAEHGLVVLEDAAQAAGGSFGGRRTGALGDVAAFSFFPSKNLGGFGDGGMITTDSENVAEKARTLRAHGAKTKYANEVVGFNSRLDELQAAVLRVKLRHLEDMNQRRRQAAHAYDRCLAETPGIVRPTVDRETEHVYHQYTVRVARGQRDALRAQLSDGGIDTMVYYPTPIHRLPIYEGLEWPTLEHSEQAAREVLSLPMGSFVADEVPALVSAQIHDALT